MGYAIKGSKLYGAFLLASAAVIGGYSALPVPEGEVLLQKDKLQLAAWNAISNPVTAAASRQCEDAHLPNPVSERIRAELGPPRLYADGPEANPYYKACLDQAADAALGEYRSLMAKASALTAETAESKSWAGYTASFTLAAAGLYLLWGGFAAPRGGETPPGRRKLHLVSGATTQAVGTAQNGQQPRFNLVG